MSAVVQLQDIHKVYDSGEVQVHAVRGVSLVINRGEFLAVMGASGSGKSTMMNLIGCLDRPTKGTYLLDGVDVSALDRDELADIRNAKLGFVFQGFNLIPTLTAQENVETALAPLGYSTPERRQRAFTALESVGLGDRARHLAPTPTSSAGSGGLSWPSCAWSERRDRRAASLSSLGASRSTASTRPWRS